MKRFIWLMAAAMVAGPSAWAADPVTLALKDHQFTPSEITVPAHQKFRIDVQNQDDTPAEFESHDLKIEKIIVAHGMITVFAGPLKPGRYQFFDDYHPDLATGTITATEP